MKSRRMHAYQVMLRVARVKEVHASMALAEAMQDETRQRVKLDGIVEARDAVAAAGHRQRSDHRELDMGRYQMLAELAQALDREFGEAACSLSSAKSVSRDCAQASVLVSRRRENIEEHADTARLSLERTHSTGAQEAAIEVWLRGRSR